MANGLPPTFCGQDSRICQQFQDVDGMLEHSHGHGHGHGEEGQIPMATRYFVH